MAGVAFDFVSRWFFYYSLACFFFSSATLNLAATNVFCFHGSVKKPYMGIGNFLHAARTHVHEHVGSTLWAPLIITPRHTAAFQGALSIPHGSIAPAGLSGSSGVDGFAWILTRRPCPSWDRCCRAGVAGFRASGAIKAAAVGRAATSGR